MGGARSDGNPGNREGVHGQGRREGGSGGARRRRRDQGRGAHQPAGDHRHLEQVHGAVALQRHRLDGRPHQRHLQVFILKPPAPSFLSSDPQLHLRPRVRQSLYPAGSRPIIPSRWVDHGRAALRFAILPDFAAFIRRFRWKFWISAGGDSCGSKGPIFAHLVLFPSIRMDA